MGDRGEKEAFVTLATNDTYALGCLVLANALRKVGTSRRLVVMVTPGVTPPLRDHLVSAFNVVFDVNLIDSQDERNLSLLGRPDLNVTFTKLHCWRLTQFQKAVFLDADTLVLQNIDDLFDREELSAAPDAGWPDCFNSGVFVFKPSEETYTNLLQFALSIGSFDGGDQGLLNLFFHDWATKDISKHLPFLYNVVSQAFYSYLPAFTQFRSQIKVVHFIGPVKPWNHPYNVATRTVSALPGTGHNQEFLQCWWNIFMESVQPRLDPSLTGLVGELAQLTISGGETVSTTIIDARERRLAWERGQADYLGADSFDNIKKKLDEKLMPLPPPPPKRRQSASPEKIRKPSTEHEVNGPVAVETLINEPSPSFSHADSEKVVEESLFTSHTADMSPSLPEALQVLQTSVPEPETLEPVKKSFDTEMKIEAAVEITASPHSAPHEEPKFFIQPSPVLAFQPDKADAQLALNLPTPDVVSIKPSEKESEREVEFTVGDSQSETTAIVTLPSLPKSTVPVELPSSKLEAGSDETTSFGVSLPEPSSVSAPKIQTVEKKALGSQQRPAPLQIQKRPPPPVPEKPTSPLVSAGVKSPPPVPQKPTFPTSPGVASTTSPGVTSSTSPGVASSTSPGVTSSTSPGVTSSTSPGVTSSTSLEVASSTSPGVASPTFSEVTSPGGAKQPPPPVAAKPTSPPVAGSFLAQRSIFEKPGTTVTKPVATGILAQKSLFEKPGSAITKPVATGILAQKSLFEKPGGTSDPKLGSSVSAASSRFHTTGAKTVAHPLASSSAPKPSSISPVAASATSPTSTPSSSSTTSSTSTASPTSIASPTSSTASSSASSSASSLRGQVSSSKNKNEEFLSKFGLRLQKK